MDKERLIIGELIENYIDISFDEYLCDIIIYLKKIQDKYVKNGTYIGVRLSLDNDSGYFSLFGDRYETDEEYNKRRDKEKAIKLRKKMRAKTNKKRKDERDKKLYERLKKKFEVANCDRKEQEEYETFKRNISRKK